MTQYTPKKSKPPNDINHKKPEEEWIKLGMHYPPYNRTNFSMRLPAVGEALCDWDIRRGDTHGQAHKQCIQQRAMNLAQGTRAACSEK